MKRINLLPQELRPGKGAAGWNLGKRELTRTLEKAWMLPAALLVFVSMALGQQGVVWRYELKNAGLRRELKDFRMSSTQLKVQLQDMNIGRSELDRKRQALEVRKKALANAQRPQGAIAGMLAELVGVFPEEIRIMKLVFTEKKIQILGTSQSTQYVTTLMSRMEDSRWFLDTTFSYTQREEEDSDDFRFEISTTPMLNVAPEEPL